MAVDDVPRLATFEDSVWVARTIQAERDLVSQMLMGTQAERARVAGMLSGEDFLVPFYGTVYDTVEMMDDRDERVDPVQVRAVLCEQAEMDAARRARDHAGLMGARPAREEVLVARAKADAHARVTGELAEVLHGNPKNIEAAALDVLELKIRRELEMAGVRLQSMAVQPDLLPATAVNLVMEVDAVRARWRDALEQTAPPGWSPSMPDPRRVDELEVPDLDAGPSLG